jgi:hypothetical protein
MDETSRERAGTAYDGASEWRGMTNRDKESPASRRFDASRRVQANNRPRDRARRDPAVPPRQPAASPDSPSSGTDLDFGRFVSDAAKRWPTTHRDPVRDRDSTRREQPIASGSGGGQPPDGPDGDEPTGAPFDRRKIGWFLAGAGVLFLIVLAAISQFGGDSTDTESTPVPTNDIAQQATGTPSLAPPGTVEPTAKATATETAPADTPTPTPIQSDLADQCETSCLIRAPLTEQSQSILDETGGRASYATDDWFWAIATHDTIALLDVSDVEVTLIRDSPETLHLYATRLPDGQTNDTAVYEFGDIIDKVDGNAIVSVAQLPAKVTSITAAGIWVEKFRPAPPDSGMVTLKEDRDPLVDSDLGVILPQVSDTGLEQTILDLQGTSSTDGTGIGTRAYMTPGNVMAGEYLFRRLESYGLTVRYEDFITPEGLLSTNIVGELPGHDDSAIYGVMAHFDSYAKDNLSIAPGADDNATGVAATLEIARILSAYELEHPVHLILVNAEETGILGSEAYARDHKKEGTPYEGIYNLDSVGSSRQGTHVYVNSDANSAWMTDLMVRLNDGYGLGQDIQPDQNPAIVADDNRLRAEGFESVLVARELFGQSPVHHTSNDVISGVSIPNTVSATQLVLLCVAALVVT